MNNAGLALGMGPVHQSNIDDFETMIKTNINGVIYVTAAVLPKMLERQSGYIINIGSVAGTYPYFGGNCYGGTKGNLKEKKSKRRTKKKKKQSNEYMITTKTKTKQNKTQKKKQTNKQKKKTKQKSKNKK